MNVASLTPKWWKARRHVTTVADPDAQVSRWKNEWLAGRGFVVGPRSDIESHNPERSLEHAAWEAGFKWAGEHPIEP